MDTYEQTEAETAAKKFSALKTSTLHTLVRGLLAMLADGYRPEDVEFGDSQLGVCWNLKATSGFIHRYGDEGYNSSYVLVEHAAASWDHPHNTGCPEFPIPYDGWNKWQGEQLEMRRDLMRHALNIANREIARRASNYHPQESPS